MLTLEQITTQQDLEQETQNQDKQTIELIEALDFND